jgi:subtilisin family serine protease
LNGANGEGQLSNVLRAIYYGTQNGANILNMSFDTLTYSTELAKALSYSSGHGVVSVASVGNNGKHIDVYPAGLSSVMGIASTSDEDTLSSFSNYGVPPVWVGAPGEGIVSPYPYGTYAAGWGTSFSAPFVSGTVALMRGVRSSHLDQQAAAQATSHADNTGDSRLGYGILDAYEAVIAWCQAAGKC